MARFRPFRAIRFSPAAVGGFDDVVAPPYDVISQDARDELYASSPYNVTRLILNTDGHEAAGELYRQWQRDGVLARDEQPAFYLYCQDFESGGARRRVGLIGALHLEPFDRGVVRPHEQTFAHHKKDRLVLTGETRANLSPIFGLFSNPEFSPEPDGGWDTPPDVDVVHEGVRNRLWPVRSPAAVAAVRDAVANRTIFIADGHHRYETALNYFGEACPGEQLVAGAGGPDDDEQPAAHVMAFLGAFEDPGMIILPTHRELVSSGGADAGAFVDALERAFTVERIEKGDAGRRRILERLDGEAVEANAFAVALRDVPDYLYIRRPAAGGGAAKDALDVTVLHSVVLDELLRGAGGAEARLEYSADARQVLDRADDGLTEGAFLMRPMRAEQMAEVCMAGELLPQKSTYFYPKLLTGLTFHALERQA